MKFKNMAIGFLIVLGAGVATLAQANDCILDCVGDCGVSCAGFSVLSDYMNCMDVCYRTCDEACGIGTTTPGYGGG